MDSSSYIRSLIVCMIVFRLAVKAENSPDLIHHSVLLEVTPELDYCHDNSIRIARLPAIRKLFEVFKSSTNFPCRNEWLKPLQDLQCVVDTLSLDACSLRASDAIEDFQGRYIEDLKCNSSQKTLLETIPAPLKFFFLHLAEDTLSKCKSTLAWRLENATSKSFAKTQTLYISPFGAVINRMLEALGPESETRFFDDFVLLNPTMVRSDEKDLHSSAMVDPKTGEQLYAVVRVDKVGEANALQHKCRKELRPIYSETVAPVMKLIVLGYGGKGEKLTSELVARWYSIAELCQLILPFIFQNESVSDVSERAGDILLRGLPEKESVGGPIIDAGSIAVEPVDFGDSIESASDDTILERVVSNHRTRRWFRHKKVLNLFTTDSNISSNIKSILARDFQLEKGDSNEHEYLLLGNADVMFSVIMIFTILIWLSVAFSLAYFVLD